MAVMVAGHICDMPPDSNGRTVMMKDQQGNEYVTVGIFLTDPNFTLQIPGNSSYSVYIRRRQGGNPAYWAPVWAPKQFDVIAVAGIHNVALKVEVPTRPDGGKDDEQGDVTQSDA